MSIDPQQVRMVEALLFAAAEPLGEADLAARLPEGAPIAALLEAVQARYAEAGVQLVRRGLRWTFQTAPDLAFLMRADIEESRRLSRAAVETLAIVAYHQLDRGGRLKGVSRAEIEDIRGVAVSKGTLDLLLEAGWVKPVGRREVPGRPTVYGTTPEFLLHFGLESLNQLPGVDELRAAGLLDAFDGATLPGAGAGARAGQGELDLDEPDTATGDLTDEDGL